MSEMGGFVCRTESAHYRLYDFAKTALISIFVSPYSTVCDLYSGGGVDTDKWNQAQIGHYIGIDASSSGISEAREMWEGQRKPYTVEKIWTLICKTREFQQMLFVACNICRLFSRTPLPCYIAFLFFFGFSFNDVRSLQLCFETEERARSLLRNISSLLKPGGYFFGITPDSSTIWSKYQKNIEASHNKGGNVKPIVPNCIRSENYIITFESEEEKFPLFGKKYQLKFTGDISSETHCLVHFPSLIRLAREAGLEYVEIQNLTEFYDDNRAQFAGLLCNGGNFVDPRGKLLGRSFDLLGLYTTFIFQKPDLDLVPPICTPVSQDASHMQMESSDHGVGLFFELRNPTQVHHDSRLPQCRDDGGSAYPPKEGGRQTSGWRHQSTIEEEKYGPSEAVVVTNGGVSDLPEPIVASKITKGILGAGPADLRFAEPL